MHKIYRSSAPGLPVAAYDDMSAFKIYLVDVGLLRRLNAQRSVFPSPTALMKALYLATFEASKNGLRLFEIGVVSMEN